MLRRASGEGYCVPAFNVVDLMSMEAAVYAANTGEAPVIMQTSSASVKRFGAEALVEMADIARKKARAPIPLHLDHGPSFEAAKTAVDAGYDSVMIDGSSHPFAENVSVTREVVAYAHERNVTVEGEIGVVAGVEDDVVVSRNDTIYTTPEEALRFQEETRVDFLAAAIGTAHGFYKIEPKLDIDTLRVIRRAADFPLVIHGGSGLSDDVVRALVEAGGAKMNVSTQIKQTYIDSLYGYISKQRNEYNIMKVLDHAFEGLTDMFCTYINLLGAAGKGRTT